MADRPVDLIEPPEGEEAREEFTRKKKSKFQTFKNFFAKKKKNKEQSSPGGESQLKPSQSSSNLSAPSFISDVLHLPTEPGSKGSMGNKALSHDSVFISGSMLDIANKTSSQENLTGKVKALQLQLQQNLQLGSPPLVLSEKRAEDVGTISEDDGLPRSPPEICTLHDVLASPMSTSSNPVQRRSSLSLGATDSEDEQVLSESSSWPLSPLSSTALGSPVWPAGHLLPVDFNSPATPLGCLDTSAARHRIAVNPRKQKAFANKTQHLLVEELEKERCFLRNVEEKTSHRELLEETANQEKDWKGPLTQNANISDRDGMMNGELPTIKASDALRYSWNAGPGTDWICILSSENQSLTETDLRANNPNAQPPLARCEEEQVEEERLKGNKYITDNLMIQPHSTGKDVVASVEALQPETRTTECCDISCSTLLESVLGKDPQPTDKKVKDSSVGSNGIYEDILEGRALDGNSFIVLEAHLAMTIPQFPSSSLEAPPEAEKAENSSIIKENTRWFTDISLQQLKGWERPTALTQEELAILGDEPDRFLLRRIADEKPSLFGYSASSNSQGCQDTIQYNTNSIYTPPHSAEANIFPNLSNFSSGGHVEEVSKSSPPVLDSRNQLGNVKMREENKTEIVKAQSQSVSAKPVRFTIAPAWQRSLSGGSSSTDSSCPRSCPSSPIRSEMFEGLPQLDSTVQGCTPCSPERLESNLNGAVERPTEDHESPFGVKLRRTSSLLKYQMEQQHQEPPKQLPSTASRTSSVSIKTEPKSPGYGAPYQNLPSGAQVLVTKSSLQRQKKTFQLEGGPMKEPMGRTSEQIPVAPSERLPSEPAWISMAKVKQKGFQGCLFAKGGKKEEKTLTKADQQGEKPNRVSQQEKQVTFIGENITKKGSLGHGCPLKSRALPEKIGSTTKAPLVRMATQEAPPIEKEMRLSPSLPLSSCSPAEPSWLSLAKKKAKAWSEMPQIVQ